MIIQCESCLSKFQVKDEDIPKEGRMVQCSNCSQKWFQAPKKIQSSITPDIDKKVSKKEFEASDGRVYRFMGSQWAEVLRSGKTGLLAKRTIGVELNRRAGIAKPKKNRKRVKKTVEMEIENISKIIDPSSEQLDSDNQQKEGLGFFGYIFLLIIVGFSVTGVLKTFENDLLSNYPQTEYIFQLLNKQLEYVSETVKNMIVIINDLIDSY